MSRRTAATVLTLAALTLGPAVATAQAAEAVAVTPATPVVSDAECGVAKDTVTLPTTEGVRYSITLDGERAVLPQGVPIPGVLVIAGGLEGLFSGDGPTPETLPTSGTMTVDVQAQDGYVLADGAPSSFDVTVDGTPCASPPRSPMAVTSDACETVSIANPGTNPDTHVVLTTERDEYMDVGSAEVPAGASVELELAPGSYTWTAIDPTGLDALFGVTVEEDTDSQVEEPTSAWAARRARVLADDVADTIGGPSEHVVTADELVEIASVGPLWDALASESFVVDEGEVTVAACAAAAEPASAQPVRPAVVQTDGGAPTGELPAAGLLLLGATLLAAGAAHRTSCVRRRS